MTSIKICSKHPDGKMVRSGKHRNGNPHYRCQDCRKKSYKKYYQINREKVLAKNSEYYKNNKEKARKSRVNWGEKNKEKCKKYKSISDKKAIVSLKDPYIRKLLVGRDKDKKRSDFPQSFVDFFKVVLTIKRKLKEINHDEN